MTKRSGGNLLLSLTLDVASDKPLGMQLHTALREMILSGALRAGERLPATRTMASDLGISRTTIVEVFERLCEEGLLDTRVGAGTFVTREALVNRPSAPPAQSDTPESSPGKPELSWVIRRAESSLVDRLPHNPRPFTTAMPALDAFPIVQWNRQISKLWRSQPDLMMTYSDARGLPALRQAITYHLRANRGISCDPEQLFIVNGAQDAFQLLSRMLLETNDKVWFENPGAIGARNCFTASGAELVPVPVDEEGMQVEVGLRDAPAFKLAFVTPSHQQPIGSTMSLHRRLALLRAAERAGAWVVEDDYDGEFHYSGRPLPTLKSIDREDRVIYVGTFSKTLFPGLRLGYFLPPSTLAAAFEKVLRTFVSGVPSLSQAAVAAFMDEGHFAAHLRRMRKLYAARHNVLQDAAKAHLRGLLEIVPANAGLHTVGYLSPDVSENAIVERAWQEGITVVPISRFCIEPIDKKGLVLGFSGARPAELQDAVKVLANVIRTSKPIVDSSGKLDTSGL